MNVQNLGLFVPEIRWPDWSAEFCSFRDLLDGWAVQRPNAVALSDDRIILTWRQLHARVHSVAIFLQRQGLQPHEPIALLGRSDAAQLVAYLSIVVAGGVAVPLPASATPAQLGGMLANCGARRVFVESGHEVHPFALAMPPIEVHPDCSFHCSGIPLAIGEDIAKAVAFTPDSPFNIIYSSGTTGDPKGIVQSQGMRWMHMRRSQRYALTPSSLLLAATPLYSNTTLVAVLPALAAGAHVHLMPKFGVTDYLSLAQSLKATHTMLVPVQYQRLVRSADFERYDLSAFVMKMCTSAPFAVDLKAQILERWPGGLLEIYGMTEGGGTFLLDCQQYPGKLHTVGQPTPGHQIKLLDEMEQVLEPTPGTVGEIVGHSPSMMTGYHGDPEKTEAAQWFDDKGLRHIRTGDLGCFDEDGFLTLRGRRKDMIISGGFNLYPIDLETVLASHQDVLDCAVFGTSSVEWGETPVACVVLRPGATVDAKSLIEWFSGQVGRTQRLSALQFVDQLPRNAIGKVDKVLLRKRWIGQSESL